MRPGSVGLSAKIVGTALAQSRSCAKPRLRLRGLIGERSSFPASKRQAHAIVDLPRIDQHRGEAFLEPFMDGLKACVEYLEATV